MPVGYYEMYSRWALENMTPCDDCSPEYKRTYSRLEGVMESVDQCLMLGYQLYTELSYLAQAEQTAKPTMN